MKPAPLAVAEAVACSVGTSTEYAVGDVTVCLGS